MTETVNTVNGSVATSDLGHTLMHEHLFINLMREYRGEGLLNDERIMLNEIERFAAVGGKTIVDVTSREITRGSFGGGVIDEGQFSDSRAMSNLRSLEALANVADVNIILGTGHYREPYITEFTRVDELSVEQIATSLVRDIQEGFPGSSVKAGIIGEIASDKWYISAKEERSFRAAARAQKATNVPLTTHAARWPVGTAQLDILEDEGVDLRRVIVGHCDTVPDPDYRLSLAERGAYVQFDMLRGISVERDRQIAQDIVAFAQAGFHEKILLSHDVCLTSLLRAYGGCGFTYIATTFSQYLEDAGFAQSDIDMILEQNPRNVFEGDE